VRDLKARGLWDEVMVADLKYFDGSLAPIDRIPQDLRDLRHRLRSVAKLAGGSGFASPEVDRPGPVAEHLHGRRRARSWTYKLAWLRGLKTTYYLRTIAATHTEKSTSPAR
jgi:ribonucleoside-diphosphate reductase alpha chain